MEKLERRLKNLAKSETFPRDKYIIKQQLSIFQHCLDINDSFFLSIATIGTHICKYSDGSGLYWTISKRLDKLAGRLGDLCGHRNYIGPFLKILKSTLKTMDERISCDQVNALTTSYPPRKQTIPVNANALVAGSGNSSANQAQGFDGIVDGKHTSGCLVYQGKHTKLYKCKQ